MTSPTVATKPQHETAASEKPAIIASRQHCEAEGVGLSHYILMDRQPAAADAAATTA